VIDRARHLRQILVAEIGEPGQARIAAAEARVTGDGLAHEVAARFAEGAGFARVVPGEVDKAKLAPDFVTLPAARAVLAGSRAALAEIRRALG